MGAEVYNIWTVWRDENHRLHRLDGPAAISRNGVHMWYIHGVNITWEVKEAMETHNIDPDYRRWTDEDRVMMALLFD